MDPHKEEPIGWLCKDVKTASHIFFECLALDNWRIDFLEDTTKNLFQEKFRKADVLKQYIKPILQK